MSEFIEYKHSIIKHNLSYPQETDIACWHCSFPFEGVPRCVPVRYVKVHQSWTVVGNFCSWSCAKAWQSTRPPYNTPIQRMWLMEMAIKRFGYTHRTIEAAPDPWILKRFGGEKTIEEFRQICTNNDMPCETIGPPLLPACMAFVKGKTNDVIRNLSATRNDLNNEKTQNSKKGIYHEFLKNVEPKKVEKKKSSTPKKRSSTRLKKNSGGKRTSLSSFMMRNDNES